MLSYNLIVPRNLMGHRSVPWRKASWMDRSWSLDKNGFETHSGSWIFLVTGLLNIASFLCC